MKLIYLYNPFLKIAGWKAFGIGAVGFAFTTLLAWQTGTHFYGSHILFGSGYSSLTETGQLAGIFLMGMWSDAFSVNPGTR